MGFLATFGQYSQRAGRIGPSTVILRPCRETTQNGCPVSLTHLAIVVALEFYPTSGCIYLSPGSKVGILI